MVYQKSSDLQQMTIIYLQNIDMALEKAISMFVDEFGTQSWSLNYSVSLEDNNDEHNKHYKIISNAAISYRGSYEIINKLETFLNERQPEFDKFLNPRQYLKIDMTFEKVRKERNMLQTENDEIQHFYPVEPLYTFSQMVIPQHLKDEISDVLNAIKYKELIYNKWGFSKVEKIPKSILNFYGPPGTGKTMCAHAIANRVNKKLLALNYAEIESKYIGDSAKNLQCAFDTARDKDCVLFFDEADSFLGKRIKNVEQGADQALNSLRSQMFILLEQFPGIVIFATNLVTNYDKAFESRILKHLKFDLPDKDARAAIIKKDIPDNIPMAEPLNEMDILKLSEMIEGFSGREIKNAILDTLLHKASKYGERSQFTFEDFKKSFDKRKEALAKLNAADTEDEEDE